MSGGYRDRQAEEMAWVFVVFCLIALVYWAWPVALVVGVVVVAVKWFNR